MLIQENESTSYTSDIWKQQQWSCHNYTSPQINFGLIIKSHVCEHNAAQNKTKQKKEGKTTAPICLGLNRVKPPSEDQEGHGGRGRWPTVAVWAVRVAYCWPAGDGLPVLRTQRTPLTANRRPSIRAPVPCDQHTASQQPGCTVQFYKTDSHASCF